MTGRLTAIHRYPLKGFSAEALQDIALKAGEYFPGDRLYAVENGPSGYDPQHPQHMSKDKFVVLARLPEIAALKTRFDPATKTLSLTTADGTHTEFALAREEGRAALAACLSVILGERLAGPPRVVEAAPGFRFTDSSRGFVSIINAASLRSLERETAEAVDPLRFRGNLLIEGLPAWSEFSWRGQRIRIGESVVLESVKRTERCAATTVNPATARRDLMIPAILMRAFGHADCGIYTLIVQGGTIRVGDRVRIETAPEAPAF